MTYKPLYKEGGTGPKGLAKVETRGDKVRVTFKDGDQFILDRSNCPETVLSGIWHVALSGDKSKMYSVCPYQGMFKFRTKEFVHKKDQPPSPNTGHKKDYTYQYFMVNLEIMDGKEKGMIVPLMLSYNFAAGEQEIEGKIRSVVMYSKPGSPYTAKLAEYMDVSGAWEAGPMPYRDNVLPSFEKRILAANKTFQGVVKNGFVDSILTSEGFAQGFEPDVEK